MYDIGYNRVAVGGRAWVAVLAKEPFEPTAKSGMEAPSAVQFVVEPTVRARFGAWSATLGWLAPLGGQLGSQMQALRLGGGLVF